MDSTRFQETLGREKVISRHNETLFESDIALELYWQSLDKLGLS